MYAQIASTPVPSKTQSPAVSVPDLDPKHVAKAGLILERLRYPSPERVLILATKKKYDTNGNFERAKSCVCPHRFRQIPHVDFDPDATESPTLAIEHGMLLLQLQVIRDRLILNQLSRTRIFKASISVWSHPKV